MKEDLISMKVNHKDISEMSEEEKRFLSIHWSW